MICLLASLVTGAYVILMLVLIRSWSKVPLLPPPSRSYQFFTSVIVPVRNESAHIEQLLLSVLNGQSNPSEYEILVIDDHSDDTTAEKVSQMASKYHNIRLIQLPEAMHGKKAAISMGVKEACGVLIVCTDGDGMVATQWLDYHREAFLRGAQLSFGPVKLIAPGNSWAVRLLNLELSALVAMGAATLKLGKPTLINGCNYSFSKEAFQQVDGFAGNENIPTGDDEFLLRKVHKAYPNQVQFLKSKEAIVNSLPPTSWRAFYHQRRRWASKWKRHRDAYSKLLPAFLFVCYLIWGILILSMFVEFIPIGVVILAAKLLVDYSYLLMVKKKIGGEVSLPLFVMVQIIYPFYVVFFGVASNFGKYSWRKRDYKI